MTLGNMRELGVQNLISFCLNVGCRHQALIDVSSYPAETEVPSFQRRAAQGSIFLNLYCAWCAASPRAYDRQADEACPRAAHKTGTYRSFRFFLTWQRWCRRQAH